MDNVLLSALDAITGTGDFHSTGHVPFFFPGIEVKGVGELAFPLSKAQAKQLTSLAEAAPYGKGKETVFDEAVRKCWQLDAKQFVIREAQWKKFLAVMLTRVATDLGITGKISAHAYKLLLYGKGGHFKAHRDTEKLDSMFGTLIIALPSAHEGGQLFIRHGGREVEVDFSRADHRHDFQHAAFFADCEHEVVPVRSGYRCCLVYNLRLDEGDPAGLNVALDAHARALTPVLRKFKASSSGELTAILLDHAYTEANFSFKNLKGHDSARARALLFAAADAGFSARLALVTRHQMGELDADISYRRRRRWDDDDDIDPKTATMGEIYDDNLTIAHWRDARDQKLALGTYRIEDSDLLAHEMLGEAEPDEKEAEGYTGNAGCTMEYWYRRAAVVLWPSEDEETILCRYNLSAACEALTELSQRKQTGPGSPYHRLGTAVTIRLATDLRETISYRFHAPNPEDPFCVVLRAILRTGSRDLLDLLLDGVASPVWNVCDSTLWHELHKAFGAEPFAALDEKLLQAKSESYRTLLFRRLDTLLRPKHADETAARIAAQLIRLAPPCHRTPTGGHSKRQAPFEQARSEIRTILSAARLLTSKAERKATHSFILSDSSLDHVRYLLAPVLTEKKIKPLVNDAASIAAEAHAFAIAALAAECAIELSPYPDWMRPSPMEIQSSNSGAGLPRFGSRQIDLDAAASPELHQFLIDPDRRKHDFRYRQDIRNSLEEFIRKHQLDLDHVTVRTSSPHVLSCTKNDNSYHRAVTRRAEDGKLLSTLREE